MLRVAWYTLAPVIALAACGTTEDDRPATLRYVTEAILAPTCGEAQCHSTFKQSLGDVFDTVTGARQSLHRNGLALPSDKADPANASLIHWVTDDQPFNQRDPQGNIIGRMPWDAPMPNADIDLLKKWIGAGVPGAQCVPEDYGGQDCNGNSVVECDSEGNYGTTVMACSGTTPTCVCDASSNTCGCKAQ
jgi:hypothetical protein